MNEYTPKQRKIINSFVVNYYNEYSRNPPLELLNNFLGVNFGFEWNMRDPITIEYFQCMMETATRHLDKKRHTT
jgi:hypothetical protein